MEDRQEKMKIEKEKYSKAKYHNHNDIENAKDFGKSFVIELEKVLAIRKERREIYGDSFEDETIDSLMAVIEGKYNRIKVIREKQGILHPKYRDEVSDIVNYLIFVLHKITTEEQNG